MKALTPKQDRFARVYVETGNASEAYRQSFSVRSNTKPESVWQEACRVLAKPAVAARVMELQEEARQRTMVTVDDLTAKLEDARLLAMSDEKGAAAAVSAVMGMAKLHGLLVEKHKLSGRVDGVMRFEVDWATAADRAKSLGGHGDV